MKRFVDTYLSQYRVEALQSFHGVSDQDIPYSTALRARSDIRSFILAADELQHSIEFAMQRGWSGSLGRDTIITSYPRMKKEEVNQGSIAGRLHALVLKKGRDDTGGLDGNAKNTARTPFVSAQSAQLLAKG